MKICHFTIFSTYCFLRNWPRFRSTLLSFRDSETSWKKPNGGHRHFLQAWKKPGGLIKGETEMQGWQIMNTQHWKLQSNHDELQSYFFFLMTLKFSSSSIKLSTLLQLFSAWTWTAHNGKIIQWLVSTFFRGKFWKLRKDLDLLFKRCMSFNNIGETTEQTTQNLPTLEFSWSCRGALWFSDEPVWTESQTCFLIPLGKASICTRLHMYRKMISYNCNHGYSICARQKLF